MTQYYVDQNGTYLGGFDGAAAPVGGIEVSAPPAHGDQVYADGAWAWPLDAVKATKIAEIEAARDAACYANATAHGRPWQGDARSQSLLGNAIGLAQAGLPLPTEWRDADNSNMPIATLADLLAIAGAFAAQTQAAYAHSWTLKAQVAAATTVAEVDAVVW